MRYIATLALILAAGVSSAAPKARFVCTIANDHANLRYRSGENAVFNVTVADTNGVKASSGEVTAVLDNFGYEKFASLKFDLAKDNPFVVTGRLVEAGFLRLTVSGKDVSTRVSSVAYEPELIRAGTDRPDDFMAYWMNEKKRLERDVPPDVKVTPLPERSKDRWNVSAISFATFGGKRMYGFISVPKDKAKSPFPVRFSVPGAGPSSLGPALLPGVISVVMNVHSYDPLSGDVKALHNAHNKKLCEKWNVPGYATSGVSGKREDYFFHDVILGIDRALDWVAARPDVDRRRIVYGGTSQGGAFGLILAGLNKNISRLAAHVPGLCDMLGRRAGRQSGWPQICKCQRTDEARAAAEKIAPYFDAAHFASYITCPVRMTVGFTDGCCAPASVYAAFNAIPSRDKKMFDGLGMGHTVRYDLYHKCDKWLEAPAAKTDGNAGAVSAVPHSLAPNRFTKLPLGAIRPEGWLKHHIDLQSRGLAGTLYEHSEWLAPDNGWLNPGINRWKFPRKDGWEEQSYWFRTFVKLAALTEDPRLLNVARIWVDKIIAGADDDGWFGAQNKKGAWWRGQYMTDIWGHMPMCEALWSWREYSGDPRIAPFLVNFFRFCDSLPQDRLIPHVFPERGDWRYTIQHPRACDMNPVLYACYEATGEKVCLDLAARLFSRRRKPKSYIDRHNVNFAQLFAYETVYSRQSGGKAHRMAADFWYDLHMDMWGQMPRGAFASDENCRAGNVDPRYGTESCTWGELARSFQFIGALTGETKWADRTEDVIFNHYPVSYTPDWKRLHYITAPNQVMLDAGWDHDYANSPPMIAYSDKAFRCCRHNAGLAMPLFTEHLAFADCDAGLVFWMYAPHRGEAMLKKCRTTWKLDTRYPFRESMTLDLDVPGGNTLPLRFRVPAWAKSFEISRNGSRVATGGPASEGWVTVPSASSGRYEICIKAECEYRFWPRNGAVTVDRGPLSYSLAIGETVREVPRPVSFMKGSGSAIWPESPEAVAKADKYLEYLPTTPWNYALDVSAAPEFRECGWTEDCFTLANAPCEIFVKGRRLPEWTLQDHQPAPLQESPAYSTEPVETLRFVPLGCARLRLSVLPVATDSPSGVRWTRSPASVPRGERAKIIDF